MPIGMTQNATGAAAWRSTSCYHTPSTWWHLEMCIKVQQVADNRSANTPSESLYSLPQECFICVLAAIITPS